MASTHCVRSSLVHDVHSPSWRGAAGAATSHAHSSLVRRRHVASAQIPTLDCPRNGFASWGTCSVSARLRSSLVLALNVRLFRLVVFQHADNVAPSCTRVHDCTRRSWTGLRPERPGYGRCPSLRRLDAVRLAPPPKHDRNYNHGGPLILLVRACSRQGERCVLILLVSRAGVVHGAWSLLTQASPAAVLVCSPQAEYRVGTAQHDATTAIALQQGEHSLCMF